VSDLTLEKLILKEAVSGPEGQRQQNFQAPRVMTQWISAQVL